MNPTKYRIRPLAAVAILLIGIMTLGGIIAFAVVQSQNNTQYFFHYRRNLAARLLDEDRSYDLINNYPPSADAVIALNNRIMMLYFGRMVNNDDLLRELVDVQQHLFSTYLQRHNNPHSRWEIIRESKEIMFAENVYLHSINVGLAFRSDRVDMYVLPITHTMINYQNIFWNYFVYLDASGRWKIYNFQRTDATFRNVLD